MRTKNEALNLSGTDMTSTITSDPIWLGHIVNYSIQVVYTGTPNGTLKIQGSNDEGAKDTNLSAASIVNWSDLGISESVTSAGNVILEDVDCGYRWMRLVWTDTSSGGGSVISVARYTVKGI